MKKFQITIRTATRCISYPALAASSSEAAAAAAGVFGDTPCGVTVICLE